MAFCLECFGGLLFGLSSNFYEKWKVDPGLGTFTLSGSTPSHYTPREGVVVDAVADPECEGGSSRRAPGRRGSGRKRLVCLERAEDEQLWLVAYDLSLEATEASAGERAPVALPLATPCARLASCGAGSGAVFVLGHMGGDHLAALLLNAWLPSEGAFLHLWQADLSDLGLFPAPQEPPEPQLPATAALWDACAPVHICAHGELVAVAARDVASLLRVRPSTTTLFLGDDDAALDAAADVNDDGQRGADGPSLRLKGAPSAAEGSGAPLLSSAAEERRAHSILPLRTNARHALEWRRRLGGAAAASGLEEAVLAMLRRADPGQDIVGVDLSSPPLPLPGAAATMTVCTSASVHVFDVEVGAGGARAALRCTVRAAEGGGILRAAAPRRRVSRPVLHLLTARGIEAHLLPPPAAVAVAAAAAAAARAGAPRQAGRAVWRARVARESRLRAAPRALRRQTALRGAAERRRRGGVAAGGARARAAAELAQGARGAEGRRARAGRRLALRRARARVRGAGGEAGRRREGAVGRVGGDGADLTGGPVAPLPSRGGGAKEQMPIPMPIPMPTPLLSSPLLSST